MMRHLVALIVCGVLTHAIYATHATYATYAQGQAAPQPGTFTFRDGRSRTIDLTVADVDGVPGIVWPELVDARWHTVLLGVQINADAAATDPYVEIAAGGVSDRQYFPSGDTGERFLNLTFVRGAMVGTRISLRGEGVTFTAPSARLRLFEGSPDLSRSILVLAPHPDDAEIAAFGLYANSKASVVTVTAGNAGSPTYEAVFDDPGDLYLFKGRIRVIDSITIPWQGRIPPERTFNMGYFDARLAEMYAKRDAVIPEMYRPNADINVYRRENVGSLLPLRPRESKWGNLVEDTLTLLKKVKPAVIVAPHPQLDTHRDHQYTTVALSEALARWNRPVTLLLYTNHAGGNRYPYGPAGTLLSLPPPPPGDVVLDRVYSHPVSPALQRLKLFALESMHDLRMSPTRQYQLAREEPRAMAPEKQGPAPDITYLRRGPRSNELFFIYDRESFGTMIKAYLASRAPR
jgi:LmbE family N-acetylglucosaminyl deacetylase